MEQTDELQGSPNLALPEPMGDPETMAPAGLRSLATSLRSGGDTPHPQTGSVALMTAVLEEAIRSCFSGTRQIRTEAETWISSGRRRSIFSFLGICETLGLDPVLTRKAIFQLVEEGSAKKSMRRTRTNVRHNVLSAEPGAPRRSAARPPH